MSTEKKKLDFKKTILKINISCLCLLQSIIKMQTPEPSRNKKFTKR